MPTYKVGVHGYREAAAAIRRMSDVRRPISEASRVALKPILDDAKANLKTHKSNRYQPGPNVVTGVLLKSMQIRKKKTTKAQSISVVAATGKGIKYAHLVEFGTDPHWQPKRKFMHPGAKPFPFLTPAFHSNDTKAIKLFNDAIGEAIDRQVRRVIARK